LEVRLKVHMEKAIEDAFRAEIVYCYGNLSKDLEFHGGVKGAARKMIKKVEELLMFHKEVMRHLDGWTD